MRIDCVAGSSMGSLVGSLYATAPNESTTLRFKAFMAAYTQATKKAAEGRGLAEFLLGGAVVIMTGGAALIFHRFHGQSDYAAKRFIRVFHSNSIGLT